MFPILQVQLCAAHTGAAFDWDFISQRRLAAFGQFFVVSLPANNTVAQDMAIAAHCVRGVSVDFQLHLEVLHLPGLVQAVASVHWVAWCSLAQHLQCAFLLFELLVLLRFVVQLLQLIAKLTTPIGVVQKANVVVVRLGVG